MPSQFIISEIIQRSETVVSAPMLTFPSSA